ncbi:YraN family protein [Candidatus Gottesmanbacteria bacterium]|nr:YraN family protein [Candidatus Gottesmanbacteria bacterium]
MKSRNNLLLGRLGEKEAEKYLTSQNYRIIERNFRIRNGEIDLIAKDKNILVFVEVKTRRNNKFGLPEEAITSSKIKTLIRSAQYYLLTHNQPSASYRIDVVSIKLDENDRPEQIKLYKNITS